MEREYFVKELSGFSGCKVNLFSSKGELFVRKISSSEKYNYRLEKQMNKQKFFFDNLKTEKISTPEIKDFGYTGRGLFFFDMEYIPSITLVEYTLSAPPEKLKDIALILIKIINLMGLETNNSELKIKEKINLKIQEIETKIRNKSEGILVGEELNKIIFPRLVETLCHGDLTFENILYNKEKDKYYLIDFLDNFAEHYWFDLVKLFQDLEGKWYLIRNPNIDKELMEVKMFFIAEIIRDHFDKDDYWKFHRFLLKLNFARILPYAEGKTFDKIILQYKNS